MHRTFRFKHWPSGCAFSWGRGATPTAQVPTPLYADTRPHCIDALAPAASVHPPTDSQPGGLAAYLCSELFM